VIRFLNLWSYRTWSFNEFWLNWSDILIPIFAGLQAFFLAFSGRLIRSGWSLFKITYGKKSSREALYAGCLNLKCSSHAPTSAILRQADPWPICSDLPVGNREKSPRRPRPIYPGRG